MEKNPMVALSYIVGGGFADRPLLHAYLQHPEWRKIWMHILDHAGQEVRDEFGALAAMRPIEAAFMQQVLPDEDGTDAGDAPREEDGIRDLSERFGLAEEFVRRKYAAYVLSLSMMGRSGHWNDDIDGFARGIGALTEAEIRAAQTDLHQAVLNRVAVALTAERGEPNS